MQHLLLDLYGCNAQKLADADYLRRFLSEVPDLIQMQRVSPVFLEHITAVSDPRDAGHSGFVIIASSHVSLHAWPPYQMINIDVFSCNTFDEAAVVLFAVAAFEATDEETRAIRRALRSPRQVNPAAPNLAEASVQQEPRPAAQSSVVLDRCIFPDCTNRTGSITTPYCKEHQGVPRHPAPLPRLTLP